MAEVREPCLERDGSGTSFVEGPIFVSDPQGPSAYRLFVRAATDCLRPPPEIVVSNTRDRSRNSRRMPEGEYVQEDEHLSQLREVQGRLSERRNWIRVAG